MDGKQGSLYLLVTSNISLVRQQQLDQFLYLSKLKQLKESLFNKLEPLNTHLRKKVKNYQRASTHLAVNKTIARYQGRIKKKNKILSKPILEGLKSQYLANNSYILDQLFHAKGIDLVMQFISELAPSSELVALLRFCTYQLSTVMP